MCSAHANILNQLIFDFLLLSAWGMAETPQCLQFPSISVFQFCIVSAKAVSQRLNNRIMSASLDKSPPSYFVEGIWKVKLAATIMQLELLYTPSQKYLYLWQKSNIFPWKELNWNWCTQHREDWQNPLHHVMVENQSTKEGRVHSFTEENLPVKKFCCC